MKRYNKFQYPGSRSQLSCYKLKDILLVLIFVCLLSLLLYPFGMLMMRLNTLDLVMATEFSLVKTQELEDFRYWQGQSQIHYTNYLRLRDKQDREEWKSLWDRKIIPFLNNYIKDNKEDEFAYRFSGQISWQENFIRYSLIIYNKPINYQTRYITQDQ